MYGAKGIDPANLAALPTDGVPPEVSVTYEDKWRPVISDLGEVARPQTLLEAWLVEGGDEEREDYPLAARASDCWSESYALPQNMSALVSSMQELPRTAPVHEMTKVRDIVCFMTEGAEPGRC